MTATLARLTRRVATAEEWLQWEFADIALAAIADAYTKELQASAGELPHTAAARKKLLQWRQATRAMTARLANLRAELDSDAALTLRVDPFDQIIIMVGESLIMVSGPRADESQHLARRIIDRFCSDNDCGRIVASQRDSEGPASARWGGSSTWLSCGVWTVAERQRARYEIDAQLWFEFNGNGELERKAGICERAADELRGLSTALRQAGDRGHGIDWPRLARATPSASATWNAALHAGDISTNLRLPLLARLQLPDWRRLVEWLQQGGFNSHGILRIKKADSLINH